MPRRQSACTASSPQGRRGTFLLESAEPGASFSRWSFVGVNAIASLSTVDDQAAWTGAVPSGLPDSGDPLEVLGTAWRALKGPQLPGLPPLTGGFVGYLVLRRSAPHGTAAGQGRRRPGLARTHHAARHRPRGVRPPRVQRGPGRQRDRASADAARRTRRRLRRRHCEARRDAARRWPPRHRPRSPAWASCRRSMPSRARRRGSTSGPSS